MTLTIHIVRRALQVAALAAVTQTTGLAQTNVGPVLMPASAIPPPELAVLAGDGGGMTARPDQRLLLTGQDGLHVSFVTPTASREFEQMRVQSSLALLSAFISQRHARPDTSGPVETPGVSGVQRKR